jgi:hypothetical protein
MDQLWISLPWATEDSWPLYESATVGGALRLANCLRVAAGKAGRNPPDYQSQLQYGLRPAFRRPVKESAVELFALLKGNAGTSQRCFNAHGRFMIAEIAVNDCLPV